MKVQRSKFKSFERYIAKQLGGERVSVSEQSKRKKTGDILHPIFFIECRQRKKLRIQSWWTEIRKAAKIAKKIPLLVFSNDSLPNVVCLIRLKDLKKLLEERK